MNCSANFTMASDGREVSTTMAFVAMLRKMLKDPEIGKLVVPIVPDGSADVWHGVVVPHGGNLLQRRAEVRAGGRQYVALLQGSERRTDSGRGNHRSGIRGVVHRGRIGLFDARDQPRFRSSFTIRCSGSSGLPISSGQRRICARADFCSEELRAAPHFPEKDCSTRMATAMCWRFRCRICWRTTPRLLTKFPSSFRTAFAACTKDGENVFYYITVMNEPYAMPAMPAGVEEGILKGMYLYRAAKNKKAKLRAQLFGNGAILNEVLQAQEILSRNMVLPRTSGASPAINACTRTGSKWSAGTACIRDRSRRCRT